MKLLDHFVVNTPDGSAAVEIIHGDLSALHGEAAPDITVVSCLPNDYVPSPGSLIGALDREGVSLEDLARNKAHDFRPASPCWLSHALPDGAPCRRILCFEPPGKGTAAQVVGEIFRSVASVLESGVQARTIAMPLLATGVQGAKVRNIVSSMVEAGVNWVSRGLPFAKLQIFVFRDDQVAEVKAVFTSLKERFAGFSFSPAPGFSYDFFISYCWDNAEQVSVFVEKLQSQSPRPRIFQDRLELNPGVAWQQKIFEALDDCRFIIPFLSPEYLLSKSCMEEFHCGWMRQRQSDTQILLPVYLLSVELPTYMCLLQYEDCREADPGKFDRVVQKFIRLLRAG